LFANSGKGAQNMIGQIKWKQLEEKIGSAVKLSHRPVAVSFLEALGIGK
jgi:hypothetical protein